MFAVGNEELGRDITNDKTAKCPNCGKNHKLRWGVDTKTGLETKTLGFVRCKKSSYLVAVGGKTIQTIQRGNK